MKHAKRNLVAIAFMLLGTSLFWVSAVATSTSLAPQENTAIQHLNDDPAVSPSAGILFGAGLLNLAYWGRKRFRKAPAEADRPG